MSRARAGRGRDHARRSPRPARRRRGARRAAARAVAPGGSRSQRKNVPSQRGSRAPSASTTRSRLDSYERASLGDRLLRPRQSGDRGPLERDEDPGSHVLLQPGHPRHQLGVPEHEAEPPARHAVALREREELDADLTGAGLGEEALRPAAVVDEIAVGEVVKHDGARLACERDRLCEDTVRGRRRDRVRRVVQVDERRRRAVERIPLGPAGVVERQLRPSCARRAPPRSCSPGSPDRAARFGRLPRPHTARSRSTPS